MDHNYRVEYVPSHQTTKKAYHPIDGLRTAKALEAMLVEYDNRGCELIENQPIISNASNMVHMPVNKGLIAIFKMRKI